MGAAHARQSVKHSQKHSRKQATDKAANPAASIAVAQALPIVERHSPTQHKLDILSDRIGELNLNAGVFDVEWMYRLFGVPFAANQRQKIDNKCLEGIKTYHDINFSKVSLRHFG